MSRGLNQAVLIGNVGARPEVRTTAMGTRVATFSVATHRLARAGEVEQTDWHRVVAWEPLAQLVERTVERGSRVYVEGRLEYREGRSRQRGGGPIAEIIAEDVIVFDARAGRAQSTSMGKERFAT